MKRELLSVAFMIPALGWTKLAFGQLSFTTCWAAHEREASQERPAIIKAANEALEAMQRSDADAVLKNAHPALRDSASSAQAKAIIQQMAPFLKNTKLPLEPSDFKLIKGDISPGVVVYCYLRERADGLIYRSSVGGKDPRALLFFKVGGASLHVELRQTGGRWAFLFAHFMPAMAKGRSAASFVAAADSYLQKGDRWMAFILYAAADQLAAVSRTIITHEQHLIEEKLKPLAADTALQAQRK